MKTNGIDDGNSDQLDGLQNDGIYSAPYTFPEAGTYTITGDVWIPVAGAAPLQRTATTTVTVTEPLITFDSVDGVVNLGPGGCVTGLTVNVNVTANLPINYIASAKLAGVNGNSIEDSFSQEVLTPGADSFALYFSSEAIRDGIAADGPYNVSQIDLLSLQDTGVALEVRELDAFAFDAITLGDLCAAPVAVAQNLTVTPTLRGGMIESLEFSFPIIVANSGSYQVSFKVTDSLGQDIELVGFSRFLNVGSNIMIPVTGWTFLSRVSVGPGCGK